MENWKPLDVAPDYEISDLGNIRRLINRRPGRVYSQPRPYRTPKGYLYISLRVDGRQKTFQHHRLVARAFWGPSEMTVNHKNGVKHDNRLENLEYATCSENSLHACRILGIGRGEKHGNAKLTEDDIREIRALAAADPQKYGRYARIARRFNITSSNVAYIAKRVAWSHVGGVSAPDAS
jgi:hypothetical protein